MNREKQIDEMAKEIDKSHWRIEQDFTGCHINSTEIAEALYNAGYRKASDVARDIFEEINEILRRHKIGDLRVEYIYDKIAELKKKYTEEAPMKLNREQIEAIQKSHWMVRDYIHTLIVENERLTSLNKVLVDNNADLEGELAKTYDLLEDAKADTVRKMQERLNAKAQWARNDHCDMDVVEVSDIDQIAKEMLEDTEEGK